MAHGRTQGGLYYDAERRTMEARDREMIPQRLLIAMLALAASALVLISLAVLTDRPMVGVPPTDPEIGRHEVVISGHDNAVRIVTTGGEVLMDTDNGAFIAVVLDGLERARLVNRVTGNPPVVITEFEGGRMALSDPASGWQVELSSFGQGNLGHFRRLFQN